MSEINLLIFGCAVSFIAAGGAYTYIRERYLESDIPNRSRGPKRTENQNFQDAA